MSNIETLHNDCSHIKDVHRRRRSRAEFGLVVVIIIISSSSSIIPAFFFRIKGILLSYQSRSVVRPSRFL